MNAQDKIKIGIIFGGSSREREISFAGGRTVYDNLDKSIFEPVLLFLDSFRKLIHLDWQYIYKGSIRDFIPVDQSEFDEEVYMESAYESAFDPSYLNHRQTIGKVLDWDELNETIDMAFLCLHGESGEDGQIQGLLEFLNIPYTGSGIFPSSLGMDKALQKNLLKKMGHSSSFMIIKKSEWLDDPENCLHRIEEAFEFPFVLRPANQGSSIGISIVHHSYQLASAIEKAFFHKTIEASKWNVLSDVEKYRMAYRFCDVRNELGYPILLDKTSYKTPNDLVLALDQHFLINQSAVLKSCLTEHSLVVEAFIEGREFSCIVLRNEYGDVYALPPTEIIKGTEVYDYRSKYLPGLSRKETPMDLPEETIQKIRSKAVELFVDFGFHVYARIDGFYTQTGDIILNDPNTTSGMLPSSFFFHQAAEIGFTPSGFINFIIGQSLREFNQRNLQIHAEHVKLYNQLKNKLRTSRNDTSYKIKVAVILGGYSSERHISVESGRNIFEKLSASEKYYAEPIFLTGSKDHLRFYKIPINLLLKDNADDIAHSLNKKITPWVEDLRNSMEPVVHLYQKENLVNQAQEIQLEDVSKIYDFAFIALHGRPGEDGQLQQLLEKYELPYNGSSSESASITIDKFKTLSILREHGFQTAQQTIIQKNDAFNLKQLSYPLIAKPVDDGCSSAVKMIRNTEALEVYLEAIFREKDELNDDLRESLKLQNREEFPRKSRVLIEELIESKGAKRFMEITGGMMVGYNEQDDLEYTIFHPSEALASLDILSLEEKFLAGEGTNITPPRYDQNPERARKIGNHVKSELLRAAKILKIYGYARIDAFVRIYSPDHVEVLIIEVNSLPGMTPATAIFHQAAMEKMKPIEFIDRIIQYGMKRK